MCLREPLENMDAFRFLACAFFTGCFLIVPSTAKTYIDGFTHGAQQAWCIVPTKLTSEAQHADTGTESAAKINKTMKLPVLGGVSQAEGVSLGALVSSSGQCTVIPDCHLGIHGALLENGVILQPCAAHHFIKATVLGSRVRCLICTTVVAFRCFGYLCMPHNSVSL